jgi:cell division protease FtsH
MGALGYTMSRPEDDRRLFTQTELQNKICVLLGGINAEEIVFQETSTGAQRDLQQASDIARSMVTEFGMSAKLGRVRYSERVRSPFLGTDVPNDSVHSEETIREIDLEVRRIIDACGKTVLDILTNRRAVLEQMSRELLECEVMDASHLRTIIDQHKTVPQLSPGTFVMHKAKPEETPAPGDEPARREAADGA